MRYGLFLMPLHPPERAKADAYDYDVDSVVLADQLGYHEAWIGEHFTAVWENLPAPDLMIAKLLGLTKNIVLGTGVHLLPYHDPILLAHRVACLDHFYHDGGSFGTVLMVGYDHGRDQAKWQKSLTLFANEVMPQFRDLEPA